MIELELSKPAEISKHPLNVWSKPIFMQTVADLNGYNPYHLVCYKGESPVAVLPLYEKKVFGLRIFKHPLLSYYQGLNLWLEKNAPAARKLLEALEITQAMAKYLKLNFKRIKLMLSPDTLDVRGFIWQQFSAMPYYTFVHNFKHNIVPLPDERRKISLAEKQMYNFEEGLEIETFIELLKHTHNQKKWESGINFQDLSSFISILHSAGIAYQMNLLKDKNIVSSNILLKDSQKAYTIFRTTDKEALKNGASCLHTLKLIEYLKNENLQELDFCGANKPDIARFKAALDLELKVFFRICS